MIRIKPYLAALCVAGFISPVIAATTPATASKLKHTHKRVVHQRRHQEAVLEANNQTSDSTPPHNLSGKDLVRLISQEQEYLPFDLDVPGQAFVSTGPYVGVHLQFAGTDLIVNSPSVNTDVQLLQIRNNISKQLRAMGGEIFKEPYHSHLLLSGLVEAQANYTHNAGRPNTSDIDITAVSLDATFLGPNEWTLGFVELNYDGNPPSGSYGDFVSTSNYRVSNSHIFVNKAFITFGNLNCSPFYGSVGQFYVPFGTYSSFLVSDTLPKLLTRTKARSLLVGYQSLDTDSFYASGYIFRGDTHVASVSRINNGGVNAGYRFDTGVFRGNFGAGYLANIADSGGMQIGNGFNANEQIAHTVSGYNLRALFGIGQHIDLIGEFVSATRRFNSGDMSFNNRGARPWAFDTEASYSFPILDNKPSSIGVGYAKSKDALAMGLPLTRTSIVFNTSLFRNTVEALEFRHDHEYAAGNVASGAGGLIAVPETGKGDNAVTAQFDYYF